jgi:four helix bundle protein
VATYNHFYDLPVYKTCRIFRKKISLLVKKHFPKSEEYHLKTQVFDSSRSITANIAEGFGRFYYQENIQFCRHSRGSLDETLDHMISAYDEKYITREILSEINKDYKECLKQLNGYIKYLKTAKTGTKSSIINNQ